MEIKRAHNFTDLTGKCFERIFVVNISNKRSSRGEVYWNCICECGNELEVLGASLRSGNTKSCGCLKKESSPNWQGCGDLSKGYYTVLKANASQRGYSFNLKIETLWKLFLDQKGLCALSGEKIHFVRNYTDNYKLQTASLDRIDSNKDYFLSNVQWVHKDINMMKQSYSQKYFIEMCRKVAYENLNK